MLELLHPAVDPTIELFLPARSFIRGPVRQILFSIKSVYTDKSSTSGRSMGWGETLGDLGATPGRAGDA